MTVAVNCDMGEAFGIWSLGDDEALMPEISMANVACGFHAGDPLVMRHTVRLAKDNDVSVGAHPSYPDLQGFGRRAMAMDPDELTASILYQAGSAEGVPRCRGDVAQPPQAARRPCTGEPLPTRPPRTPSPTPPRRSAGYRCMGMARHQARGGLHGSRPPVPGRVLRRSRVRRRRLATDHPPPRRLRPRAGPRAGRARAHRRRRDLAVGPGDPDAGRLRVHALRHARGGGGCARGARGYRRSHVIPTTVR